MSHVPEIPWPTASSSRTVLTGVPATPVPSWEGPEGCRTAAGVAGWSGRPCRCIGTGPLAGPAPWPAGREHFRGRRHPARDVPLRSRAPCPASGWRLRPPPWTASDRGPRPARRLAAYCSGDHDASALVPALGPVPGPWTRLRPTVHETGVSPGMTPPCGMHPTERGSLGQGRTLKGASRTTNQGRQEGPG